MIISKWRCLNSVIVSQNCTVWLFTHLASECMRQWPSAWDVLTSYRDQKVPSFNAGFIVSIKFSPKRSSWVTLESTVDLYIYIYCRDRICVTCTPLTPGQSSWCTHWDISNDIGVCHVGDRELKAMGGHLCVVPLFWFNRTYFVTDLECILCSTPFIKMEFVSLVIRLRHIMTE